MTNVSPSADHRRAVKRDEPREFGGVAAGIAAGALVWLVFLSLMRLPG
jgi:hypothetical protein